MENGSNGPLSEVEVSEHTNNGVGSFIMLKDPDVNVTVSEDKTNHTERNKVNGDNITQSYNSEENSYSSESDALVIDESIPKKQKKSEKKTNVKSKVNSEEENLNFTSEILTHSNPYFNESLFELSQLHNNSHEEQSFNEGSNIEGKLEKSCSKHRQKKGKCKPKPKLEYAQYLGLQPTLKFKCSKCGRAIFESLSSLQEHVLQCNEENVQEITENSCSGFKLTRKVFLCATCGTYYENWNLYMHMLEFHRRYICLYCLGMFSVLEDLCQHIQSRHNIEPGHKNTLDEFFNVYNEPCYVVCCECNKLFSEQDNFFYHNCSNRNKFKKFIKQQITPENHVTGESESVAEINKNDSAENIVKSSKSNEDTIMDNEDIVENSKDHNQEENVGVIDDIAMDTRESLTQLACEEKSSNAVCHEFTVDEKNSQDFEKSREVNDNSENYCGSDIDKESEDIQRVTMTNENPPEYENTLGVSRSNITDENFEELNAMDNATDEMEPETQNSGNEELLEKFTVATDDEIDDEMVNQMEGLETRKVPKLSLKLPKRGSYVEPDPEDSDDSEKLMMEVDQIESENENEIDDKSQQIEKQEFDEEDKEEDDDQAKENGQEHNITEEPTHSDLYQVAGSDIPIIELELEQPLDKFDPRILLQKCLKTTSHSCIYCNHARKIAVNGRQLALHCIAEHRFSAIVNSITAEELIPESFVNRIKETLDELDSVFFNLESSFSNEAVTFSHLFECFQCHFSTSVHKELYLHNRKFHSKNLLLCIMCKSNFYSYSELICHLCPGLYVLDYDVKFRCCMCVNDDLPSSFRLMVHLRKRHNICDVCLETCHTQYRLSNHVWKHKLHHFCYRCGIAYRNKPDITRHLFWKHGTESVLCKKCVQKKWPHVYHFCVPPANFACEECGLTFTKAVSVKVHKRIHSNEKKWACTFEGCEEKFISKKLMEKHERRHWEPSDEVKVEEKVEETRGEGDEENKSEIIKEEEKPKPKIDVLDLPALNLSESDSSDSEAENIANNDKPKPECTLPDTELEPPGDLPPINILQEDKPSELPTEEENPTSVIQHIWDNFKNYQESKQKLDSMYTEPTETTNETSDIPVPIVEEISSEVALRDHDYCSNPEKKTDITLFEVKPALNDSVDHDYCFSKPEGVVAEKPSIEEQPGASDVQEKVEEEKKRNSSSSSSDSDSSSCSCGSNCSCSSSSGGSSSSSSDSSNSDSSTEEGRKKQLARRQKRKERAKKIKEAEANKVVDVVATDALPVIIETPIRESDLDTTESETDEEFYDEAPQKLAKKLLEEKRQQLQDIMGPNSVPNGTFIESTSRPPTPPAEVVEEERKKKKSKSKKRKKKKSERREQEQLMMTTSVISPDIPIPPYYQQFHQHQQLHYQQTPSVAPITLTISRNSPVQNQSTVTVAPSLPLSYPKVQTEAAFSRQDSSDSSLRASKRRRVPNKFYGYSSDEDQDKVPQHVSKWRKTEVPQTPTSPMVVPPITIKTIPQEPAPLPQPTVEPISIRTGTHLSDFRVQRPRPRPTIPPIRLLSRGPDEKDSDSDSNDSSSEEQAVLPPKPAQPQLYCYCQCPYDEVSEMIGCDASDCAIEWFHFECVGIMVPPKGQWFCPDCRKKKARRELMQNMKN
ncbi:misexpression suppressor of ras 4 [Leptinotarsa decemlineata]|uniref:misexpression suppressor of ras 4 n=1 Tax=Leptinotarsa decemlineata TaxID=7539 RepID=UPI003D30B8A7